MSCRRFGRSELNDTNKQRAEKEGGDKERGLNLVGRGHDATKAESWMEWNGLKGEDGGSEVVERVL